MAKRNKRGGAPPTGSNGSPTEAEKIQKKMARKRAAKADKAAAPDVRELSELEAATARAILAEKQVLDERKKVFQLQDQLLKAQTANLQMRANAHNAEVGAKDKERNDFLKGLGVEEGDKADLEGGKLVITRGANKK